MKKCVLKQHLCPENVSKFSRRKVWWLGKCGHEWTARISDRTKNSNGCPYCTNKRVGTGINDLQTMKPDLADEWHPIKNGNLLPSNIVYRSNKKVWWKCKEGHEWQAPVVSRSIRNYGCPICRAKRRSPSIVCCETGTHYSNASEASKALGIKHSSRIYSCCRGEIKTVGGYHWKFDNENR